MTLDEVKESYKKLIGSESTKLSRLKKQIFQAGTIRLVIVLVCIFLCYLFWGQTSIVLLSIGFSTILFLFFYEISQ